MLKHLLYDKIKIKYKLYCEINDKLERALLKNMYSGLNSNIVQHNGYDGYNGYNGYGGYNYNGYNGYNGTCTNEIKKLSNGKSICRELLKSNYVKDINTNMEGGSIDADLQNKIKFFKQIIQMIIGGKEKIHEIQAAKNKINESTKKLNGILYELKHQTTDIQQNPDYIAKYNEIVKEFEQVKTLFINKISENSEIKMQGFYNNYVNNKEADITYFVDVYDYFLNNKHLLSTYNLV